MIKIKVLLHWPIYIREFVDCSLAWLTCLVLVE